MICSYLVQRTYILIHTLHQIHFCNCTFISIKGERRLRELETMTGYSAHRKQSTTESEQADESYDDDSWINTKDEEDKRGRVGTQWPWEK